MLTGKVTVIANVRKLSLAAGGGPAGTGKALTGKLCLRGPELDDLAVLADAADAAELLKATRKAKAKIELGCPPEECSLDFFAAGTGETIIVRGARLEKIVYDAREKPPAEGESAPAKSPLPWGELHATKPYTDELLLFLAHHLGVNLEVTVEPEQQKLDLDHQGAKAGNVLERTVAAAVEGLRPRPGSGIESVEFLIPRRKPVKPAARPPAPSGAKPGEARKALKAARHGRGNKEWPAEDD